MPPDDYWPGARPLSNALISAALGGLLSLTSCRSSDPTPMGDAGLDGRVGAQTDAGPRDAGSPGDAGADASAPSDAGLAMDAGTRMDASAMDAGAMDASARMDAAMDASAPRDAGRGPRDAVCDVEPDRHVTDASLVPGITLEDFTTMCDDLGGYIEIHPHCGGMNSCRGVSYDTGTGILMWHSCAGLNTCTGFSCVIP